MANEIFLLCPSGIYPDYSPIIFVYSTVATVIAKEKSGFPLTLLITLTIMAAILYAWSLPEGELFGGERGEKGQRKVQEKSFKLFLRR